MTEELEIKLDGLKQKAEAFQQEMMKQGQTLLQECFTEIFNQYPDLKYFSWTQYTPYFNDGDTCYFGVNEIEYINGYSAWYENEDNDEDFVNLFEVDKHESGEYHWQLKKNGEYASLGNKIEDELNSVINAIPDEIMQQVYGDHVKVVVSRTETKVEDYDDHD